MSKMLCDLSPVIYLHRKALTSLSDYGRDNACSNGLAMFDAMVKLQGRRSSLRLTVVHMLWASVNPAASGFVSWLQLRGLLPFLNLNGANLSGADLSGADLSGADLWGANLSGANRLTSDPAIPGWTLENGVLRRST